MGRKIVEFFAHGAQSARFFSAINSQWIEELVKANGTMSGARLDHLPSERTVKALRILYEAMAPLTLPHWPALASTGKSITSRLLSANLNPSNNRSLFLDIAGLANVFKGSIEFRHLMPFLASWLTDIGSQLQSSSHASQVEISRTIGPLVDPLTLLLSHMADSSIDNARQLAERVLPILFNHKDLSTINPLLSALIPPTKLSMEQSIKTFDISTVRVLLSAAICLPSSESTSNWVAILMERCRQHVRHEMPSKERYLAEMEYWSELADVMLVTVGYNLLLRTTRAGAVKLVEFVLASCGSNAMPFVKFVPFLLDTLERLCAELEYTTSPDFVATDTFEPTPLPLATAVSFLTMMDSRLTDLERIPYADIPTSTPSRPERRPFSDEEKKPPQFAVAPEDHISTLPKRHDPKLKQLIQDIFRIVIFFSSKHQAHYLSFETIRKFIAQNMHLESPLELQLPENVMQEMENRSWSLKTLSSSPQDLNGAPRREVQARNALRDFSSSLSTSNRSDVRNSHIRGITNSGNTCFVISVLQLLFHTLEFRSYVFAVGALLPQISQIHLDTTSGHNRKTLREMAPSNAHYSMRDEQDEKKTPRAVLRHLALVFGALHSSKLSSVDIRRFIGIFPKWISQSTQEDANEFYKTLLRFLAEEWYQDHHKFVKTLPWSNLPSTSIGNSPIAANAMMEAGETQNSGFPSIVSPPSDMTSPISRSTSTTTTTSLSAFSDTGLQHSNATSPVAKRSENSMENSMDPEMNLSTKLSAMPLCPIEDLARGRMMTLTLCTECQVVSQRIENMEDLTLHISPLYDPNGTYKIEDLMLDYFKAERMEGDNMYSCETCKKRTVAEKCHRILVPPRYLLVNISRFQYQDGAFRKQMHRLQFGADLAIPVVSSPSVSSATHSRSNGDASYGYMDIDSREPYFVARTVDPSDEKIEISWDEAHQPALVDYSLFGCIVHSGLSMNNGHYYTFARDSVPIPPKRKANTRASTLEEDQTSSNEDIHPRWHLFNDQYVEEASLSQVLASGADSRAQPYLLCYVRSDPPIQPIDASFATPTLDLVNYVRKSDAQFTQQRMKYSTSSVLSSSTRRPSFPVNSFSNMFSALPRDDDNDYGPAGAGGRMIQ